MVYICPSEFNLESRSQLSVVTRTPNKIFLCVRFINSRLLPTPVRGGSESSSLSSRQWNFYVVTTDVKTRDWGPVCFRSRRVDHWFVGGVTSSRPLDSGAICTRYPDTFLVFVLWIMGYKYPLFSPSPLVFFSLLDFLIESLLPYTSWRPRVLW